MNTTSNKAFLSHQSSDKSVVKVIGKALLDSGIEVFYDEWDIAAGDSIPDKIEKALGECNIFIYALSQASIESKWVETEYHSFLYRKINDQMLRIIPVLLADCKKPAFIAPIKHIDFRAFKSDTIGILAEPIESLLRSIFRSSKKPILGTPNPALASFEVCFQKMKNPPPNSQDDQWEIGFKNVTDLPLLNFAFAIEFVSSVNSVTYDFSRSSANMVGGEGLSADNRMFHWFGNQIAEDGEWVVFVIHSMIKPEIKRFCTKFLGRRGAGSSAPLFRPDPSGLQEIATAIKTFPTAKKKGYFY